jgi:hypothetical protein
MKMKLNTEKVTNQLNKNDICNWVVIEGVKKINQGNKIGKNMEYFLIHLGILEYIK